MTESPFADSGFVVPMFSPGDDLIACLNKAMAFLTVVASNPRNQATIQDAQEAGQILDEEQLAFLADPGIPASQDQIVIPHNAAFQTEDLDTYDSDCDDLSTAQVVLMAKHSLWFESFSETTVQDTNLQAQQDSMILSVIEQSKYDLGNVFSPQQELSAEQAFWFHTLNPTIEPSYTPPIIVDVPSELPKDLKAQIQDKVFVITSLKNDLQKLKGKEIVENDVHIPSANTIALGMFKLDLQPLPPRLLQNREVHIDYLRNSQEQANILQEIVKQAKAKQPLDGELDLACKYTIRIQELLVYVQDTCPNAITPNTRKVAITPMNNVKKGRFAKPITSSSNSKQVESSNTSNSNTPVLSSTGVKCSTRNCRSKPPGNKKNDRISQTPSRNKKNKVEARPRKVNNSNRVVKPVCDVDVKHSLSNTNSEILCATCNKSMFDGVHDKCLLDLVQNGNKPSKSKSWLWHIDDLIFTVGTCDKLAKTDNGTEFVNQTLREWYENVGITYQTSVARTPQQNGVVERRNRTLVEAA
ncbi:retrovirus-related pol polyprotein from transposon TNT 1-94 [Tanacetum coccineum]